MCPNYNVHISWGYLVLFTLYNIVIKQKVLQVSCGYRYSIEKFC